MSSFNFLSDVPIIWNFGLPGCARGPATLKAVLLFICFLALATCFNELWKLGANRKAKLKISNASLASSMEWSKLMPALWRKSALPDLLVTDLFPCFKTFPPAVATTKALNVEQLKIFNPEPPVPQVSI